MHIKLISSDGLEFYIAKSAAVGSLTIKNMLSAPGQFSESDMNEIKFQDIKGNILEKVCEYLEYKEKYSNALDIPEFVIEPEIALELLMAADFLDT